jgi:hypothetical protein
MQKAQKLRAGENPFAVLMLVFSLFVLYQAYKISGFKSISSAGSFPMAAAGAMVIAMIFILKENRKLRKAEAENLIDEMVIAGKEVWPRVILFYAGFIVAYVVLIQPLHFMPSSFVFLLVSIVFLKGGGFKKSLLIATGMLFGIYIVFQFIFRVCLP